MEQDNMSAVILDGNEWADNMFAKCDLGDKRLTKRLQTIGGQLAANVGASLSSTCGGDTAALEGSYRFIRNKKVKSTKIATAGFESTKDLALSSKLVLAIEDTSYLNFPHSIKEKLGNIGAPKNTTSKGIVAHSCILVDAATENTLGLINQNLWIRDNDTVGKKHDRKKRDYIDKESYKWEDNSKIVAQRMGDKMSDVISICDREADIYEYIDYKISNDERFIVRASHNRKDIDKTGGIFELAKAGEVLGTYDIDIEQKQARKKRHTTIELRARTIKLAVPVKNKNAVLSPRTVNVVVAYELEPLNEDEQLMWVLLTTEDVSNFKNARHITRYYELRWRIEDFHKAWKSGAGVERQRMQEVDNLEKMIVLLSFIAIRLLQLKEAFEQENNKDCKKSAIPCTALLSADEWRVLWRTIEKKKKLPAQAPTLGWAYVAIAKLGGWCNTKGTNKASWNAIWDGWFRLCERVEGYRIAENNS